MPNFGMHISILSGLLREPADKSMQIAQASFGTENPNSAEHLFIPKPYTTVSHKMLHLWQQMKKLQE
jgi:hypothetical protein